MQSAWAMDTPRRAYVLSRLSSLILTLSGVAATTYRSIDRSPTCDYHTVTMRATYMQPGETSDNFVSG